MFLPLQSQMIGMLYGKSLRLHASARNEFGTGAIVNLQSNDAQKLWWIPVFMHVLWSAPIQVLSLPPENYLEHFHHLVAIVIRMLIFRVICDPTWRR